MEGLARQAGTVDRVIALPTHRLVETERGCERKSSAQANRVRNKFRGDVLKLLNKVVAEIRANGTPTRRELRMADSASLCPAVSKACRDRESWHQALKMIGGSQSGLLPENDLVVQAVEVYVSNGNLETRGMKTAELCDVVGEVLFGSDRLGDANWPRGANSFGKRLARMRDAFSMRLRERHSVGISWYSSNGVTVYRFEPLNQGRVA